MLLHSWHHTYYIYHSLHHPIWCFTQFLIAISVISFAVIRWILLRKIDCCINCMCSPIHWNLNVCYVYLGFITKWKDYVFTDTIHMVKVRRISPQCNTLLCPIASSRLSEGYTFVCTVPCCLWPHSNRLEPQTWITYIERLVVPALIDDFLQLCDKFSGAELNINSSTLEIVRVLSSIRVATIFPLTSYHTSTTLSREALRPQNLNVHYLPLPCILTSPPSSPNHLKKHSSKCRILDTHIGQ